MFQQYCIAVHRTSLTCGLVKGSEGAILRFVIIFYGMYPDYIIYVSFYVIKSVKEKRIGGYHYFLSKDKTFRCLNVLLLPQCKSFR